MPSRFDRLYRPTELSHFDKVFSRPWATPSRLSHEDQHKSSLDDEGIAGQLHQSIILFGRAGIKAYPNDGLKNEQEIQR